MKQIFPFLFVFFLSCSENKPHIQQQQNVPQALAEQKSDVSLFSKRSGNNLVQELYDELLKSDPLLSEFENAVAALPGQASDSLNYYKTFIDKNDQYYISSETYIAQIKDSVLKTRLKALFTESKLKAEHALAVQKALVDEIEAKNSKLSDLHNAVKLTATLTIMEKYQKENQPAVYPMKAISKKYDILINKADSLIKK